MKKENTFIMTAEGFLEAENELNELKNVRRPEVIKALKEARALGDLSENADYDAARNEQAIIEAKIQELEYKLEHAEIIDNKKRMKLVWVQQLLLAMMMVKKKNIKLLGLWKLTHLKIKYQMNHL